MDVGFSQALDVLNQYAAFNSILVNLNKYLPSTYTGLYIHPSLNDCFYTL